MKSDETDVLTSHSPNHGSTAARNVSHILKPTRVSVLMAILLTQCLAFLWFLPTDLLLVNRIRQRLHSFPSPPVRDYAALSQGDQIIGSELPHDEMGNAVRRTLPKSSVGYLLVPVGDCTSCLKADLPLWQREAAKRHISMILLSSASKAEMKSFKGQLGLSVPIVSDVDGKFAKFLNVAWLGRPYLFSADWHLLWASHEENALYNPFESQDFEKALAGGSK